MIKDENVESRDNVSVTDSHAADASPVVGGGGSHSTGGSHHHAHSSHHSHHSHRHTHHHSRSEKKKRRSRDKNKRKQNFLRFLKRNKAYIIYVATVLLIVGCLVFVAVHLDNRGSGSPADSDGSGISETSNLNIAVPIFSEDVSIVGTAVEAYLSAQGEVTAVDIYKLYASGGNRLDVGLPVSLSYKITGVPSGYEVDSINFVVADNKTLTDPITASASGYEAEVDFYNLKTGTRYYYSVNVSFKNGAETAVSGSFKTASGPRLMNVPGVNNMRDIGGWTTTNGSVIKQGLLYRGCEIDGAVEAEYAITAAGIEIMLTELGIRFDMDLRFSEENKYGIDILGSSVEHAYYSAPMYVNVFKEINAEKMRAIFADLADESNYPIYMHCTYGQDRTGTVCYILEALLGLSEEDLMKEYQLSALYHGYQPMDKITEFVEAFKNLEGESMSEKAEGYLLSIGVTAEEIANIRRIHLSE